MKLTSEELKRMIREEMGGVDMKLEEIEKNVERAFRTVAKNAILANCGKDKIPQDLDSSAAVPLMTQILMKQIKEILNN